MNKTSIIAAALAFATSGAVLAQGNPPTTAPANPATAAGQQNPAGGPMGTTGTTPQNNSGSSATMQSSGSMATGTSNDTSMASNASATQRMRPARADRN